VSQSAPSPFRLASRKHIGFASNASKSLQVLVARLLGLDTPDGELETILELIEEAKREIEYAPEGQRPRIMADLVVLEQRSESTRAAIGRAGSVPERIALAIERERQPREPRDSEIRVRFVNPPPMVAPRYFQDRFVETTILSQFIRDPGSSLITVSGRGGIGKTAFVCRALKHLEGGTLPDDGGELEVAGIVYMNAAGSRAITFPNIFSDLLLILEPSVRQELQLLADNPQATVTMKVRSLLQNFRGDPVVLLLDNFEDAVSSDSREVQDPELANFLKVVIENQSHSLKIIVTTRVVPVDFADIPPSRCVRIFLDEGLESPFAERILKELDSDGHVGLRDAAESTLTKVKVHTRGFPRALEAFYSILAADRDATMDELLSWNPGDRVVRALVGEAFSRLSELDQRVMQALAVYGHPSSSTAVDFLLEPWFPFVDSALSLNTLVNMRMVRKEDRAYYLHPIDREYALSRLDSAAEIIGGIQANAITKELLLERAADYYEAIRRPHEQWRFLEDVDPQLREFSLRLEARGYDQAAEILSDVLEFLDKRGAFEQIRTMGSALQEHAPTYEARGVALKAVSTANWRIGRVSDAVSAQEKLVELVKEHGTEGDVVEQSGNLLIFRKDLGVTEELLQSFRDMLQRMENDFSWSAMNISALLHNVASCQRDLGYLDEALENELRSTALARKLDVDWLEGATHNLANIYLTQGNIANATTLFEEALSLSEQNKNPLWKANHLGCLAHCFIENGDLPQAIDYTSKAITLRESIGDFGGIAANSSTLALCLLEMGDLAVAHQTAERALQLARDLKQPLWSFQENCAEILLHSDKLPESQRLIERSLEWRFGGRWSRANILGLLLFRRRMRIEAKASFNQALAEADTWLGRSARNPSAWSGKGLALAGLVACGETTKVPASVEAYEQSRRLQSGFGTIAARQRLFAELRKASPDNPDLKRIRFAISGEDAEPDGIVTPKATNSMVKVIKPQEKVILREFSQGPGADEPLGVVSSSEKETFVSAAVGDLRLPAVRENNLWYQDRETDEVLVFVHGIFSDSRSCWLREKQPPVYWPDLVSRDCRFDQYSLYLGGYFTALDAGAFKVQHCADHLYRALDRPERPGAKSVLERSNIVFVCHSTGGIIVRYMLESQAAVFKDKTIGLVLIASPSFGSGWADKLSWLSELYNAQLARQLEWGNNSLDDLDERFQRLIKERRIPRLRGIEAYENHFIFHRKLLPDRSVVVNKSSAGRYFAPPHQLPQTDHFTCVKPDSERHPAHELLVDFCSELRRTKTNQ
jgi:tetratricopeptide (TPR) repeat protein